MATKRQLGRSGIEVMPFAFGGNVFGWTVDEATSFKLLDAFVAGGMNFIDTADVYSAWVPGNKGGESETIIGKWLKQSGNRSKVVIATKLGLELGPGQKGLSRTYMTEAVERSLKRLQTDYIDLYQAHSDDSDTPLEETLGAFSDLMKQGKVRAVGGSNYSATRFKEALQTAESLGVPRYESLQPHYNLYTRHEFEAELAPLCEREKVGVIPYYSLASGFLTGKYRSEADLAQSKRGETVKNYLNERGRRILSALDAIAEQQRSTPAKVALAWLSSRPSVTAPIASATSIPQLEELLDAVRLELDDESLNSLDKASK